MYIFDKLDYLSDLKHAFSTIDDGNMSFKFDEEVKVINNRILFLEKLSIKPNDCIAPYLEHTDKVLIVEADQKGNGVLDWNTSPHVDALITKERNMFLFMLVADCLPIILYDKKTHSLGLVHAGWKGVELHIVTKAVQKMQKEFGVHPKDIVAIIGPCIRKDSYRFENVLQKMPDRFELWKEYLSENTDGTTSIDLVKFVRDQLNESGVTNIIDSEIDTAKDKRFFSHYRDSKSSGGDVGRYACVVGMI